MKRGQVTIFIIAGIVIVAGVALFFLFRSGIIPGTGGSEEINSESFLETCLEPSLRNAIETISLRGGKAEPELYREFEFTEDGVSRNVAYLCYTNNYYVPCINQNPILISSLKLEIKNYVDEDVRNCFANLKRSLGKQGYVVEGELRDFDVGLSPGKAGIAIDASLKYSKSEEERNYEEFEISIPSKFYDLAIVAQEIVSQEARFCYFEYLGFMLLYPEFDINKFRTGDSTTFYTVSHRESGEKFRFAIRGCVSIPGF